MIWFSPGPARDSRPRLVAIAVLPVAWVGWDVPLVDAGGRVVAGPGPVTGAGPEHPAGVGVKVSLGSNPTGNCGRR